MKKCKSYASWGLNGWLGYREVYSSGDCYKECVAIGRFRHGFLEVMTQSDLNLEKLTLDAVCRMDHQVIEHTPGAQLVGYRKSQGEHWQDIGLCGGSGDAEKWIDM